MGDAYDAMDSTAQTTHYAECWKAHPACCRARLEEAMDLLAQTAANLIVMTDPEVVGTNPAFRIADPLIEKVDGWLVLYGADSAGRSTAEDDAR